MGPKAAYQRILLKVSGEVLAGFQKSERDEAVALKELISSICKARNSRVQIGIVMGGGNILRGISAQSYGLERVIADQMGMLSTIINSLSFQQMLQEAGCPSVILSAVQCGTIVEPYDWKKAVAYLEQGNVVLYAGGTGNPFFSTDTAAALRALETKAEVVLKATKVDGIYDKDPIQHKNARMLNKISYSDFLKEGFKIMDATAVALCRQHKLPIHVFNLFKKGSFLEALCKKKIGTIVAGE